MRNAGPSVYRHYKGGYYRVLFEGVFAFSTTPKSDGSVSSSADELDGTNCVVYCSMSTGDVFVRKYTEFHEIVIVHDASPDLDNLQPRFQRIAENAVIR